MEYNYYFLFILFTVIGTMIVIDPNVAKYIVLLYRIALLNVERLWWMIKLHPKNPIQRYLLWRRSWKMAEEMMKEYESKAKE